MDKAFFKQLDQQHLSADNRRHINTILDLLDNRYSEITASGNLSHYQDYAKLVTLDVSPKVYEILSYDIKVLSDSSVLSFYKLSLVQYLTYGKVSATNFCLHQHNRPRLLKITTTS